MNSLMNSFLALVLMVTICCCGRNKPGANGSTCSVHPQQGGTLVSCTNGTSSFVPNGETGATGASGRDGTNGTNGTNGSNGLDAVLKSGPVGSMITANVSACHHDYMVLSNGWLLFRHQLNGTADEGAGTSGFQVWNVDITDSLLISEVGSVTYCTLHFNKTARTLSYVVNTNEDGKQNETGLIDLN